MKTNNLMACPECDALQRVPDLEAETVADCVRCGAELARRHPASLQRTLAFMFAAAVALACANAFPVMELESQGIRTSSTIYGLVRTLFASGWPSVAIVVLLTVIVVPTVQMAASLYVLGSLVLGRLPFMLTPAVRTIGAVWRWGMLEVFLLGAMVSLVKLAKVATVDIGWAVYAVGAYIVLVAAAVASFDGRAVWRRVEQLRA